MIFIQTELDRKYNPETDLWDIVTYSPCPFGLRKLEDGSERCYYGNGVGKCKYFVRYDWEKHPGCIACSCNLPRVDTQVDSNGNKYEIDENGFKQLVLDF